MWHYRSLHAGSYYLLKEQANTGVELVYIAMITEKCVLVEYQLPEVRLRWFKKEDEIAEVIEQLSEEHAQTYEELFEREHDNLNFEEWEEDTLEEDEGDDQLWRTLGSSSSVWDAPEEEDDDDNSRLN